ncbi:MAG: TonB-dependent receptor [Endomicrobium sp.]|nr:TonB-dependent receptor [Endomicrobium sp.]
MDSPIIEADISYGSFNTFSPSIISAYSNNKYSILATLSNISRDGDRTNSKFVNTNVFFSGQINASENSKISLTGNIYNAKYGLPGSLLIPTLRDKQQDNNKYLKLDYDFSFDKNKSVSINGYCSRDIMRNQSYLYSTDDRYTSDTYGFQTDFHYADVLLLGAEYWKECFQDDSRKNCAVYSQLNYDIWKFRLIPSLRVDNNSVFGWVFTPALSAIFNLNDKVKFSANSGKVWRAPTFNDLYYPGLGNPDLKPEYGLSSDIGAEYSYGKIKLIATGFYINSKDLIRWDGTRSKNIAKTKQYGFEFEAGYIMNLLLSHKLNYTYLKAEDESTKKILEYTPENTINYILNIKFTRNFTISAVVCYRSDLIGTRYYPDNSISVETIDGFFTLDMNINYKLNENIDFWIKGFNLTNTNYQMFCDYPMPKLTVYAGINARVLR